MGNNRIKIGVGSFDFIKGAAMIVIIAGHMTFHFDLTKMPLLTPFFACLGLLQSPFIPLFFIISGYGFKEKPPGKMLHKTFKELIIPYIGVMVAYAIFYPVSYYYRYQDLNAAVNEGISYTLAFLLGLPERGKVMWGYTLKECSVVWFLLTLFLAFNLMNLILKIKNNAVQILLVALSASVGYVLIVREITFFCIPQGLIALSYCYLGYLMKKYKWIENASRKFWLYAVWALLVLVYANWGYFNLCYGDFVFFPIDYIGAAGMALLLIFLGVFIGRWEWRGLDWVKQIGVHSYWILSIHSVEMHCVPWGTMSKALSNHQTLAFFLEVILKAVIMTICCKILKKIGRMKYNRIKVQHEREKLYR